MQSGTLTSKAEVVQITPFGLWVSIDDKEYYLDYKKYPWFQNKTVAAICNIETDKNGNIHWPDLDVDIELASLENPQAYPLVYR